jgi:hypothetical protein
MYKSESSTSAGVAPLHSVAPCCFLFWLLLLLLLFNCMLSQRLVNTREVQGQS